jgi:hypothetical protein
MEYFPRTGFKIETCSTYEEEEGAEGRGSRATSTSRVTKRQRRCRTEAHIIDFVSSNIVSVEDLSRRSDHFEVQIVQEHSVCHDGVVWIHPNDGRLQWSRDVMDFDDVTDLLVGIDRSFDDLKLKDCLDSGIG